MRALPKLLSKTKIMRGYRCLKSIYYTIHRPDLEPPITPAQRQVFDQGDEVGRKAREYYPGGVLVDCKPWEFGEALKRTRELLKDGTSHIYEAAFEYKGCYARADILKYNPATQRWSLLEVKSTLSVKPEHIEDVGLQAWIIANSGLKLERIAVVHLNRECRFPNLDNLFVEEDVTERLREHYPDIAPKLNSIFKAIRSPNTPDVDLGPHCSANRRDCEFRSACFEERGIPELSIFNIPRLGEKTWEFYKRGQISLDQVDVNELDENQKRMVNVHLSGKRFEDAAAIRKTLSHWKFPLVYLDFETIGPAIPRYPGCAPYQQVPFQFSVHIQREPGGEVEHFEFLHDREDDPRPTLIPELLAACGTEGSVVSYFARFESERIQEMADFSPVHAEALLAINARMVDPLPVVREHLYDPAFNGSFSLKAVAPAILGSEFSYEGMAVSDGTAAQRAFMELIREDSEERRQILRADMLAYCKQDTLAMVRCVDWLFTR